MEIIIDAKAGTVSVDKISRSVALPLEYAALDIIHYDTETAIGIDSARGYHRMGGILGVSLALWHAAAPSAADVWVMIKAKRAQMNASGVFVAGDWYHTDAETLAQYAIMYAAISVNSLPDFYVFNPRWKTMSGDFRPMTVALLKRIINTGMRNAAINFAIAERHKAVLQLADVPSKYDYSIGWVKGYI